jgi:hypothetical protein
VAHFEFTCYCGRDHYAGDGYVTRQCCDNHNSWDFERACACGRRWQLYGTERWNSWQLVDKLHRVLTHFGRRRRDPFDVTPRQPWER